MKYDEYRFKFYLNANHYIYIDGIKGQNHPHTWEIILEVAQQINGFVQFHEMEREIESYLVKYQDKQINEIEPFNAVNPTLENICIELKKAFAKIISKMGWKLLKIEISETPTRSYIIDFSDEIEDKIQMEDDINLEIDNLLNKILR